MPQKIFDIFPPKPPLPFTEEKGELDLKRIAPPLISEKQKWWGARGKAIGGVLIFLITAVLICQFVLAKAEIVIWPETEISSFTATAMVNLKANQLNLAEKIIPGKIFEEEKSISQEFSSSGTVLKKAEGTIRLYNAYTTQSEVWRIGTRFVSADGKLFQSKTNISVLGATIQNGKLVPSYTDVEVIAAEAGEDYNIGPSAFSIYIYRGTPRYTAFYGKSFSPMTGGGEAPRVTQEDLDRAKDILTEKLRGEGKSSLINIASPSFVLLDEAINQEITEASSLAKVGAELGSFIFQAKIKSKGLGFKLSDLENFAQEIISLDIPETKKIQVESLKINYLPELINIGAGQIILDLAITAKIYSDINQLSLKRSLLGKSAKEAQMLLENQPQIIRASLNISPFWLKKIPQQEEKIKIELNLD